MISRPFAPRALMLCIALFAQPSLSVAQETAPVPCKDGTTAPHGGRDACGRHGGIDEAATAAAAQGTANTPPPVTGSSPSAPGHSNTSPTPTNTEPAAGGGSVKVWVNTASKVYHCPSDRWYGKTRQGAYMTEAEAKAKGNHADHNKPCV
jgi:hypothetical protein